MTNVRQQDYDYEEGKIKILWDEPSSFETIGDGVSEYKIMKDVGTGIFYHYASVDGYTTNYTDTGLVLGKKYNYKIVAANVIGEGLESAVLIGTAGQEPGKIDTLHIETES